MLGLSSLPGQLSPGIERHSTISVLPFDVIFSYKYWMLTPDHHKLFGRAILTVLLRFVRLSIETSYSCLKKTSAFDIVPSLSSVKSGNTLLASKAAVNFAARIKMALKMILLAAIVVSSFAMPTPDVQKILEEIRETSDRVPLLHDGGTVELAQGNDAPLARLSAQDLTTVNPTDLDVQAGSYVLRPLFVYRQLYFKKAYQKRLHNGNRY